MEGKEGGKGGMIPWWVGLICGVVGEIIGMMVIIICMGGKKQSEEEWAEEQKLIYSHKGQGIVLVPSDKYDEFIAMKKAADAGTSTAAQNGQKGNLS